MVSVIIMVSATCHTFFCFKKWNNLLTVRHEIHIPSTHLAIRNRVKHTLLIFYVDFFILSKSAWKRIHLYTERLQCNDLIVLVLWKLLLNNNTLLVSEYNTAHTKPFQTRSSFLFLFWIFFFFLFCCLHFDE